MGQDISTANSEKTQKPKRQRKQIQPCLIPGNYYFVDELIEGGVAGQAKFSEWFRTGKLKALNLENKRYIVSADQIIAIGMMDEKR